MDAETTARVGATLRGVAAKLSERSRSELRWYADPEAREAIRTALTELGEDIVHELAFEAARERLCDLEAEDRPMSLIEANPLHPCHRPRRRSL